MLRPFNRNPAIGSVPARVELRLTLSAAKNPEVPSAKTISPKNGNPQTILPPLPNGGISMSDMKTRTSVPNATIPVIREKNIK